MTIEEILKKNLGEDLFWELSETLIFSQPSGNFPMIDLIYSAIEECIHEDRKIVAEKAEICLRVYNKGEFIEKSLGQEITLNSNPNEYIGVFKESIINAPKLQLK